MTKTEQLAKLTDATVTLLQAIEKAQSDYACEMHRGLTAAYNEATRVIQEDLGIEHMVPEWMVESTETVETPEPA